MHDEYAWICRRVVLLVLHDNQELVHLQYSQSEFFESCGDSVKKLIDSSSIVNKEWLWGLFGAYYYSRGCI